MSTTPTELLETTAAAVETTLAAVETAAAETVAAAEGSFDFSSIKEMMDGFDPAALLPDLSKLFDSLAPVCRFAVLVGPVVLLILGLAYLLFSPKEANYYFGYRCYFGMGSEYAWRFTQRLAGTLFTGAGLVLTVVMLTISGNFAAMAVTDMVWKALSCVLIEIGTVAVLVLIINLSAAVRYDRKGQHRRKNKR